MTRLKKVTEEVARWVFEVHIGAQTDWQVAFTNPTAGPWKRVMATDISGQKGEVHRFMREETRPDLVLISDANETIIILEAKTTIDQLMSDAQVRKSIDVVQNMGQLFRGLRTNPYWHRRADFTVMCGLLWGGESPSAILKREELVRRHKEVMRDFPELASEILLVECIRKTDQALVSCTGGIAGSNNESDDRTISAISSLNLEQLK